ncbi:unnamed protein product, partial [marine sediment metagenome]
GNIASPVGADGNGGLGTREADGQNRAVRWNVAGGGGRLCKDQAGI